MAKQATIVVVVGILLALGGCAGEAGTREAASVAPSLDLVSEGEAGQGAPEVEAAQDPFAGEMPDFMVEALVQRLDGELLDLSLQRALFDHAQDAPQDARPWLLLAADSMARRFHGIAVRQYASALEADASVAQLPGVLIDLQSVIEADDGAAQREASDLVVSHWGEQMLPGSSAE